MQGQEIDSKLLSGETVLATIPGVEPTCEGVVLKRTDFSLSSISALNMPRSRRIVYFNNRHSLLPVVVCSLNACFDV